MSRIQVHADDVTTHGAKLDQIATEVLAAHGSVAATSGAAAGTPVDGAMADLIAHWSSVMPHFAASGASLSAALAAAGANYAKAEGAIVAGTESARR
jgi:predicted TIM-barrel enzyme